MTKDRTIYSANDLERLLDPRIIAVVGASETPGSFGERTLTNLAGFSGHVYGVNPKYTQLFGRPCVPTLRDLPQSPDCVAVCVARPLVAAALEDAVAVRAGGIIAYASGFAETGIDERTTAQARLAHIAQSGGVRFVGPNTVGMANVASGAAVNFMAGCGEMIKGRNGPIAIVSQSGALGYTLLQSMHRGIGISHFLTAGNSCDVDICDYVNYLAAIPHVRAIICLFEGIKNGERFLSASKNARRSGKALIVYKAGNSRVSSKAAFSHTGSLVGSAAAYSAAIIEAGAVEADSLEATMELASLFAKTRAPMRGRGVGIMATSGGAGVINADKAEAAGLPLPDLAPSTRRVLETIVPDFGSVANPCDTTAEVLKSSSTFAIGLEAFANDPNFSAVVVPLVFAHAASSGARAPTLCDVAARADTVIAAVWMNEWLEGPGSAMLDADPNVAMFRSSQRCFEALRIWHDWHEQAPQATATRSRSSPDAALRAREFLAALPSRGSAMPPIALSEHHSKYLLALYGIATPQEEIVTTAAEAAEAAQRIGFPVVAKIASVEIAHKTDVGGVRLNLRTAADVRSATEDVIASVASRQPGARVDGVSIQAMIPAGVELVLGIQQDEQFGPLIVAGIGGVLVELLCDVATRIAPVSTDGAHAMLNSLRGFPILAGYRGNAGADLDAAIDAICRLSELASDLAGVIEEADLNPLIVGTKGAIAADAVFFFADCTDGV